VSQETSGAAEIKKTAVFSATYDRLAGPREVSVELAAVPVFSSIAPPQCWSPMPAAKKEASMMRLAAYVLIGGLVWLGGAGNALAQGQDRARPGPEGNGQYSFHRMGEGFIRLDSRTGQLSQCGWNGSGWHCKAVPDERAALEAEIARLQRQNAEMKKSLLSRGIDLPAGIVADAPVTKVPNGAESNVQVPKGPTEAEFDRAIAYAKQVWRKLVEMMVELQRDMQRKS
jgi:hypothetical protein